MKITQNVKIDLARRSIPPLVDAVQGDSARCLALALFEDGHDWLIPQDVQAVVRYCNTAGGGGAYDTLEDGSCAWSISGNKLTVALAPAVCAVAGDTQLQVTLMRSNMQVSTFAIVIRVQRTATATQENGDYVNLQTWLNTVNHSCLPDDGAPGQVLSIKVDGTYGWRTL